MRPQIQFLHDAMGRSPFSRRIIAGVAVAALALWPAVARGQQAPPPSAAGQIEGGDVSVEGGTAARNGTATVAPVIYVSNGSVVTVHSGRARMTLFTGGKVDICGPAKFTLLESNGAITLALNFGRVRAEVPAATALRIFTPTIIATPIEISGGSRDVSVGLSLDDSLCVVASSGAIRLEHQFSGEKLIVPQSGEFFLGAGKLVPVAGTPGSCQCPAAERETPPSSAAIPEFAGTNPPNPAPETKTQDVPLADEEVSAEFKIPEHANEAHPVAKEKNVALVEPPQVHAAAIPVLIFTASAPVPPANPTPDFALLIREARVSPLWGFSGRVDSPDVVQAMQHALGESSSATQAQPAATNAPSEKAKKKKGGFWAALKRAFGGGGT
jgi:hypothetical protein